MLKEERRKIILDLLSKKMFVKNTELASLTDSTIQTIIADINFLDEQKRLIKVYGGAKSLKDSFHNREKFEEEKELINPDKKEIIGKKAAELVKSGMVVFVDTGTTVKAMIKYLKIPDVIFITSGYAVAHELSEYGFEVILVGGKFYPRTKALIGPLCVQNLKTFYFDQSFIGANGYSEKHIYTTNLDEALIKETVINQSKQTYVLMDSSKFNKIESVLINNTKSFKIIDELDSDSFK